MGKRWTAGETACLEYYVEQGMSNPAIAAELGRTRSSIEQKKKSLKLTGSRDKLNWGAVREIRRSHANGFSVQTLSRLFEVTRGTIYNVLKGKTWPECVAPVGNGKSRVSS